MSNDPKDPKTQDVIATAEDGPEALSDEQVTDANGGWSWGERTVVMSGGSTMIKPDINAETLYGGGESGDVLGGSQLFGGEAILRKRPGR